MHFRKEWHRRGALKTSATPPEKPLVQPRRVGTRWRIPHEPDVLGGPGKHSHLWVWLGQRYHTRRGQRSRVVIPGERGLALRCSDRQSGHQVEAPKENGVGYPTQQRPQSEPTVPPPPLRSAWGVRTSTWGSPHRNPQTPRTPPDACPPRFVPGRTPDRGRGRGTPPCLTQRSLCATPRGHVPTRRTWTIHESFLSVLNAQTRGRQWSWRPEAPEIDRTQKRTGDKTSLKRRDHPCTLLEKSAL